MKLTFHPLDLKLKHTFQIARETRTIQNNVIVLLQDNDEVVGLGEAAPTSYFGEDVHSVTSVLAQSADLLRI